MKVVLRSWCKLASLALACVAVCFAQTPQNIVVTSGASFLSGLPPKGSIGTIFCTGLQIQGLVTAQTIPLPQSLAGVSVTVGGASAPLFAVVGGGLFQQINFQVPQEAVFDSNNTAVVVVAQNESVGSAQAALSTSPGDVFTIAGTQFGVFQHASGFSLVTQSNPARSGEILVGYMTGLPGTQPVVPTGEPAPLFPLVFVPETNTIARVDTFLISVNGVQVINGSDLPLKIYFIGLTPGLVGVYQINFIVPVGLSPGDAKVVLKRTTCHFRFVRFRRRSVKSVPQLYCSLAG